MIRCQRPRGTNRESSHTQSLGENRKCDNKERSIDFVEILCSLESDLKRGRAGVLALEGCLQRLSRDSRNEFPSHILSYNAMSVSTHEQQPGGPLQLTMSHEI